MTFLEIESDAITAPQLVSGKTDHSLYNEVLSLASELLAQYDAKRYEEKASLVESTTGEAIAVPTELNPASFAIFSRLVEQGSNRERSHAQLIDDFESTFREWFGDPLEQPRTPQVPNVSNPSDYQLPFPVGETWYYTGGPHHYESSGARPWSSIDFGIPTPVTCKPPSPPALDKWIVATKGGEVIESKQALVVINHRDGFRTYYSHVATEGRHPKGEVNRGDQLGHPSCEVEPLGDTEGIHVHLALWKDNEGFVDISGATFSRWRVQETTHYDGTLTRDGVVRYADRGRIVGYNDVYNYGVSTPADSNCPNITYDGVILYRDKNCWGGEKRFNSETGWTNLPDFNDDTSSIYVKNGWSVRVYQHASYDQDGGKSRCITGSMWDLRVDYYPDSNIMIDQTISSVQVFENGSCSAPPTSCPDNQYKAEYYNGRFPNGNLIFARCENSIDNNWGGGGPGNGVWNDNFSVRWTGNFNFDGNAKRFIARADDGIRVYLDGSRIIDGWRDQAPTDYKADRTPGSGKHEVKVEYYENGGGAEARLRWETISSTVTCPDNQYKAEYYNGRLPNGNLIFARCESSINYDWGGGGPGSGVSNDNFSVRWTGRFNFDGNAKRFIARADDGIKVYLDGSVIIDAWRDQGATEYKADRTPSSGVHEVKVEYYENGGGAVAQVRWENAPTNVTCPNQYKAEYWSNRSMSGNPVLVRCEGWPLNHNWGGGSPGNGVPSDGFSARWTAEASISQGTYDFVARADDGIRVYVGDSMIIDGWRDQAFTEYRQRVTANGGNYRIRVEYYESGGGAAAQFFWEQVANPGNIALNRPATATSQESSTYSPSKGNDGSSSTRWSSMISSTLGWQSWYVDLGSARSFNRVRINWENAYAATYRIIWSEDGVNWYYSGSDEHRSGAGWAEHNLGTRTRRYVGVVMMTRASKMNNYSFFEFEAYGPTLATNLDEEGSAPIETTVPETDVEDVLLPPQE